MEVALFATDFSGALISFRRLNALRTCDALDWGIGGLTQRESIESAFGLLDSR